MRRYLNKTISLIVTLFLVSLLVFAAFQVISDPAEAMLGTSATPENLAAMREELGLNRPAIVRYLEWLGNFLRGDYGTSYNYHLPVGEMLREKLPVTAGIVLLSFVMMLAVSFPIAIHCAKKENGLFDRIMTVLGQISMSIPAFLLGVLLTYVFGIFLRLFVYGQYVPLTENPLSWMRCMIFPAIAIAIPRTAMAVKMLRTSVLSEMQQNYVTTAYARGSDTPGLLKRHVLRNAILPFISFVASSMAEIITNCILVEQVFNLPGIGVLLLSSIGNRDFPVVQTLVVFLALWVVGINYLADILSHLADPRLRET